MSHIDDLVAQLAQDASVVKPVPPPFVLCLQWVAVAAVYLAIALAFSGLRPDFMAQINNFWFVAEIAALLGIFVSTSFSAAILAFPDLHQKSRLVFAPILPVVLFLVVLFFAWNEGGTPVKLPIHSYECSIDITLMTVLPAVWSFFMLRKYASTHCGLAGSIALLSAFSVGALWLRLHEETDSILHVVEWHYGPMILAAILGLWLGKIVLKW